MEPRKILVIRFSSIGDIVLTSPIVRCLKEQLPHSEIHFLTKRRFGSIVEPNPYLHHVWLYDGNFKTLLPQLKAEQFDFIVDLHNNLRSRWVAFHVHRPHATFSKVNLRKWMLVNLKWNLLPKMHVVDRYFQATRKLNITNDRQGLDFFIPPEEEVQPGSLWGEDSSPFLAISIGGQHATKILPAEKVIELCKSVSHPIILLGGKEDQERGEKIAKVSGNHVVNGCGHYTLHQSASWVRQAAVVVTNDTGLMHIAAAFRKPILSVWGNTVPDFGMYPYLPDHTPTPAYIFEVKNLACRPCSKIGYEQCPKHHFKCMADQDIAAMVRTITSILK